MNTMIAAREGSTLSWISRIQRGVHSALEGENRQGLTKTQAASALLIVSSVVLAILGTEVEIRATLGSLFPIAEALIVSAFVIEYLLRVWSAGADSRYTGFAGRLRYIRTPFALLDLVSVLPFLIGWGAQSFLLRLLRLVRLLALSRLLRYSEAMRLVVRSILSRRYELFFAVALAFSVILLAAGALYTIEGDAQPETFGSIPRSLWWAVETLTTVGYGDVVPVTPLGRFFAALTAIAGIGLIAMPTGILAAAFSEAFTRARQDENRRE